MEMARISGLASLADLRRSTSCRTQEDRVRARFLGVLVVLLVTDLASLSNDPGDLLEDLTVEPAEEVLLLVFLRGVTLIAGLNSLDLDTLATLGDLGSREEEDDCVRDLHSRDLLFSLLETLRGLEKTTTWSDFRTGLGIRL